MTVVVQWPSGRSSTGRWWKRFLRQRGAVAGVMIVIVFGVVAAFANVIAAWYGDSPDTAHPGLLDVDGFPLGLDGGISGAHWFGVEPGVGRDLFLQIVFGARTSLGIAVTAGLGACAVGVVIGLVAGYLGSVVDIVVCFLIDTALAFPVLYFAFAAIPILNQLVTGSPQLSSGPWTQMLSVTAVLIMFGWPGTARLVRGEALTLRGRSYVEAAVAIGARPWWIVRRHLLPNLLPQVLVAAALTMPGFISTEAVLSFLGLGVPEPVPDWGRLVFNSIPYIQNDWTFTVIPSLAIFVVVVAFNMISEGIRRTLSPAASGP